MPSRRAEVSVGNLVKVSSRNARYGSMRLERSGDGIGKNGTGALATPSTRRTTSR